ncbi:MAG: thiamine phosphate synthase [Robiginitomaculum sp.]|nr:MAG: thiamine phosphate synthase [Robiginitomaculum sp.]
MSKSKKKSNKKSGKKKSQSGAHTPAPTPFQPCQIYLLTPPHIHDVNAFAQELDAVLNAAPIACLQIRLKDTPEQEIVDISGVLIPICHAHGTMVLINDDPKIAAQTGADGVHLGQSDMDIKLAKEVLSPDAVIGVTCHNSRELAFKACSDGADYVAFGACFEGTTKPDAELADLEIFTWWHEAIEIPCVAIGGVSPDNAQAVIAAGADFIALSSGVWDHADGPVEAVTRLHALCAQHSPLLP